MTGNPCIDLPSVARRPLRFVGPRSALDDGYRAESRIVDFVRESSGKGWKGRKSWKGNFPPAFITILPFLPTGRSGR